MTPVQQFRRFIVRPALEYLGMLSDAAEDICVGTAVHESGGLKFFEQITGRDDTRLGPALGFFQMEPATFRDINDNFLAFRPELSAKVKRWIAAEPAPHLQLINPYVGAIYCRLQYYRCSAPLPAAGDIDGYAAMWKLAYNTPAGKGTPAQWALAYRASCGD